MILCSGKKRLINDIDATSAKTKATYKEIRDWVKEKYGFHVRHLNIVQERRKHWIIERENYNKPVMKIADCPDVQKKKLMRFYLT